MTTQSFLARMAHAAMWDIHRTDVVETDDVIKRRRFVVIGTLVSGAVLLTLSLAVVPAGDPNFYWLALLLAAVWIVGGLTSGPLHLGRIKVGRSLRRPVITSIVLGSLVAGVFVVGALLTREVPLLRDIANHVLAHARKGSTPLILFVTAINGVGEEIFFRGALYSSLHRHRVALTTAIYTLVTVATLNLLLVFAAATLGVVLALQRRASGGILAPMLTHVTWSTILLFALPPLFS